MFLRHHRQFAPEGTNVNFVEISGANIIHIRTYERGVETETLACGTGSIAAAVISHLIHAVPAPVRVHVRSGEELLASFSVSGVHISSVILEGSAHMLFEGSIEYANNRAGT